MTSQRLTCFARLASLVENLSEDVLPPAGLLVVFFTLVAASRAHASSPIPQPTEDGKLTRLVYLPESSVLSNSSYLLLQPLRRQFHQGAGLHFCSVFVAILGPILLQKRLIILTTILDNSLRIFFDTFNLPAKIANSIIETTPLQQQANFMMDVRAFKHTPTFY